MKKKKYPYLLVAKHKHETKYYLIQNESEYHKAGMAIIDYWQKSGYFRKDDLEDSFTKFLESKTGMPWAEIDILVKNPSLTKIKIQLGNYGKIDFPNKLIKFLKEEYIQRANYNKNCEAAKDCLNRLDGALAWELIDEYNRAEYQIVEEKHFDSY